MSGIDLETLVRDALSRAQESAPTPPDMFAGIVRRRRRHRRNVALVAVAALAALAAIAVPVTVAVSALQHDPIAPTGNLHQTATPIGNITGQWRIDTTDSTVVVGSHAFQTTTDTPPALRRIGSDGIRHLRLPASLVSPGDGMTLAANTQAVYVTLTDDNSDTNRVLRIDPESFSVTGQTTLPDGARQVVANDTGLYVMGDNKEVYWLDPTTLAVTRTYQAIKRGKDDYDLGSMFNDRDGIDLVASPPYRSRRKPWLQHLSSDLQPAGEKVSLSTVSDLNLIGSSCGVVAVNYRYLPGGTKTTVTFDWPSPQSPSVTVRGAVDSVARACSSNTAYVLTNSGDSADVIRILRVHLGRVGKAVVTSTWTPDPMLPFTGMSLIGRDLWLIGPTIARVRPAAS